MNLRHRRLAILFAASTLGAAFTVFACSTDNGSSSTGGLPGTDAGRDRGQTGDDEDIVSPDSGPDCANAPTPRSSTGPFCFSVIDGGTTASKNCLGGSQICCSDGLQTDGGFAPSDCIDATQNPGGGYNVGTCGPTYQGDGGQEWHCTEAAHCPGANEVCCAIPSAAGNPMPGGDRDFPGCSVYFQSGRFVGGTRCKQNACGAGDLTLCASDADCTAGKCVSITISGRYAGYCRIQ